MKSQFNKVEKAILTCQKEGYLSYDFVADEAAKAFHGVVTPSDGEVSQI